MTDLPASTRLRQNIRHHYPERFIVDVGTPDQAFAFSRLPHHGVGLTRLEFITNRQFRNPSEGPARPSLPSIRNA